jgi:hypothetical protein
MTIKCTSVLIVVLCVSTLISRSETVQQENPMIVPQTVMLYLPGDKATGEYDETKACFSFKLGRKKLPNSTDWDLGYGFLTIANEDWLMVGTTGTDKRSVIKELGAYKWSDTFETPVLEPLPELKKGERRQITVDSSADTHQQWAKSTSYFVKSTVGHMYLVHVKDNDSDFYVLFRIAELEQGDHGTISWKRIPTPESLPSNTAQSLEAKESRSAVCCRERWRMERTTILMRRSVLT